MQRKALIFFIIVLFIVGGAGGAWYYWTHRYDALITQIAAVYKLDPALVKAIIYEESFFNPRAHSSQNAVGLMQITPVVAQEWMEATRPRKLSEVMSTFSKNSSVVAEPSVEEALSDPAVSLHAGCWYLQTLLNR